MNSFSIPEGPSTVAVGGTAAFTVNNTTDTAMRGSLTILPGPGAKGEWFRIGGDSELLFPARGTPTVAVKADIPPGTPPGDYRFQLRVAAVNDPDNDTAESPTVTVTVAAPAAPPPPKSKWWLWLLIALAALLVLGIGGWALLHKRGPDPEPQPSATASQPQSAVWFGGTWTGTIDGRPAALRWRVTGPASNRSYQGDFSDGNNGSYVPMTYLSHNASELRMRHPDGNEWYLRLVGDGQATGWTTWQGNRYPLVMLRQSTEVR